MYCVICFSCKTEGCNNVFACKAIPVQTRADVITFAPPEDFQIRCDNCGQSHPYQTWDAQSIFRDELPEDFRNVF
jgi:hypothetical protein